MEIAASRSIGSPGCGPPRTGAVADGLVTRTKVPTTVVPSGPRRGPRRRDAAAPRRRGTARGRGAARKVAMSLDAVQDQGQRLVVGVDPDGTLERLQRPRDPGRVVGLQLDQRLAGGHLLPDP